MAMKSPSKTRNGHGQSPPLSPSSNSGIDVEAELGVKPVRRPMDIDQDVTDLGQKKRVSSVLTSPMFKEELETVVTDLLRSGDGGGQVIAREIANMLSPHSMGHTTFSMKTGVGCVSPINDITGSDTSRYTKGEKLARCKLAALYRLVDLNGWSMQIYNHISYRVDKEQEHFLINPFGLMYHEVSAAKLLKINMQGDVIDQGTTNFPINKAGFTIHSAIHSGRPDLNCVVHIHVPEVIAVSMMEGGILPISQEACILGDVSVHPYTGIVVDQKEKKALIKHLGPNNKVMLLKNHGMLACGETIEEAFHLLSTAVAACKTQIKVLSCIKPEKVIQLDKATKMKVMETVRTGAETMVNEKDPVHWGYGELLFEAYMRMLDNMGYRTGYQYKNPMAMSRRTKPRSDVELPGNAHGHTIPLEDIQDVRSRLVSHPPSRWVNSPNQYTKVSTISEGSSGPASLNGDASPKTRARWSKDGGSSHSTPIRISDPNQFVPKNTDPREVAEKRKMIRGQGKHEGRGPGPQSQKLDSYVPSDRRGQLQDGVFTASKGIIQRDFHDQTIVTGPPNPFASISNEEIEKYKLEVTQVQKDPEDNEDVFVKEEAIEHTIQVVAHIPEEPTAEASQPEVNGSSEPDEVATEAEPEQPAAVSVVTEIPQVINEDQKDEKKKVAFSEETPKPISLPTKQPSPKIADKPKEPPKANGEETAPAPKAKQEEDGSLKTPEDHKSDSKGKHKESKTKEPKKQKRRSLSFLKKNKEKKEKE